MHLAQLKAPDLWPPVGLSKEADSGVRWVNASVSALRYHVQGYAAALELYRFSRSKLPNVKPELAWDWQWIGIHDAGMRIWFLRDAMDILRKKSIPGCPTIAAHADDGRMVRAISLFDTHFPEFRRMRNAVPNGLYSGPQIKEGDCFELFNDGIRYSLEMTSTTLGKLTEVLLAFWSFRPVEAAFDARGRSE